MQSAQYETDGDGSDEYARYDPADVYHTYIPRYTATAVTMIQNAICERILVYMLRMFGLIVL